MNLFCFIVCCRWCVRMCIDLLIQLLSFIVIIINVIVYTLFYSSIVRSDTCRQFPRYFLTCNSIDSTKCISIFILFSLLCCAIIFLKHVDNEMRFIVAFTCVRCGIGRMTVRACVRLYMLTRMHSCDGIFRYLSNSIIPTSHCIRFFLSLFLARSTFVLIMLLITFCCLSPLMAFCIAQKKTKKKGK